MGRESLYVARLVRPSDSKEWPALEGSQLNRKRWAARLRGVSSVTTALIRRPWARPLATTEERCNISHIQNAVHVYIRKTLIESITFLFCLPMPTYRKFLGGVSHCFHGQHFKAVDV